MGLVLECLYQYNSVHGKRDAAKAEGTELDEGFGASSVGLEVDPTRLTDADSLDVNKYKLMTTCQTFLESSTAPPPGARPRSKKSSTMSGPRSGQPTPTSRSREGGFYLLRLFCPAITSPQE